MYFQSVVTFPEDYLSVLKFFTDVLCLEVLAYSGNWKESGFGCLGFFKIRSAIPVLHRSQ